MRSQTKKVEVSVRIVMGGQVAAGEHEKSVTHVGSKIEWEKMSN